MLQLIFTLCWEALICPFTTATIFISCWIWMKFFIEEWDSRIFSLSYNDVVVKNQWWRILVAPLSHNAVYHLLLNMTVLWGLRLLELNMGTLFVFRYTIVLAISETFFSLLIIHFTIKLSPVGPLLEPILTNNNSFGSSGVIMAWLAYQSLAVMHFTIKKHFVLFGLISISQEWAMPVMTVIYYVVLGRQSFLSNLTGILSGLFLYVGWLQIIPDFYWSLCFLLNVALIMFASVVLNQNAVLPRSVTDEGGELVEVQSYGSSDASASGNLAVNNTSGSRHGEDNEEDIETGSFLRNSSSSDNLLSSGGSQRSSLSNRLTNSSSAAVMVADDDSSD